MKFYDLFCKILENINSYLIDYSISFVLIVSGVYFTFKHRFVQVRCFKEGLKRTFSGIFKGGNSSFRSLATAVAAQVGTGNIVGAASAILIGGAGSVFWMWVVAFFGMATVYSEAVLAQKFAVIDKGERKGGPVYYILGVFKGKIGKLLSILFALATVVSLSFTGTMVQSNAVALTFSSSYDINPAVIGTLLAVLCAFVYTSGADKLMKITEKIVPIMSIIFILSCIIVLILRGRYLSTVFKDIFISAFNPKAAFGGGVGITLKLCISQGVKRGLFSNEAGMGSTPHAHAAAKVNNPHEQGTVAMMGVFVDTFAILTLTALVMLTYLRISPDYSNLNENNLMLFSLQSVFGKSEGNLILNISLFLFGFTSIISWNYFGRLNFEYLFKSKGMLIYYVLSIILTCIGGVIDSRLVWNLSDFSIAFMILPNILALLGYKRWNIWSK